MTKKITKEVLESKRDITREMAIMDTPIRMDGVGEDPVIQKVASSEFSQMSNSEAFDVVIALQQLLRGNASIMANQDGLAQELAAVKAKMAKYDEDARKWDTDRQKFLEEINRKADKLRVTDPSKKAALAADAMNMEKDITAQVRAEVAVAQMQFKRRCETAPRVTIVSPGIQETGMIGDQPVARVVPEVIRIKNATWTLKPNVPTEVPDFVAKRYENIQRERAELAERQNALSADRNNGNMTDTATVAADMARIDKKYGTASESM